MLPHCAAEGVRATRYSFVAFDLHFARSSASSSEPNTFRRYWLTFTGSCRNVTVTYALVTPSRCQREFWGTASGAGPSARYQVQEWYPSLFFR